MSVRTGFVFCVKVLGNTAQKTAADLDMLSKLEHDNIVQYLGTQVNPDSRLLYIFTEFCHGGSLVRVLQDFRGMQEPLVQHFAYQVCHCCCHFGRGFHQGSLAAACSQ